MIVDGKRREKKNYNCSEYLTYFFEGVYKLSDIIHMLWGILLLFQKNLIEFHPTGCYIGLIPGGEDIFS